MPTRSSVRSRSLCFAVFILLTSISLATATAAPLAEPSEGHSTSALVVCARTDIPQKGAPTLELVDLERYFVTQLWDRDVQHVQPCATAKIPNPPTADLYVLELSVDALRRSVRTKYDETGKTYVDDPVFAVDLSLSIGHFASGKVLGRAEERREYHLSSVELDDSVIRKRACIYQTADHLADRFLAEAEAGHLGEELRSIQQPPPSSFPYWLNASNIAGISCVGLATMILIIAFNKLHREFATYRASAQRRREQDDAMVRNAFCLALKTDNFSDEACRAAAVAKKSSLLANHAVIENKEAQRRLHAKLWKNDFRKIAAQAAERWEFTEAEIFEILCKAADWEFRVLQEAKKLALEVNQ